VNNDGATRNRLGGSPEEALKDVAAYVAALLNVQPGTVYGDLTREDIYDGR